MSAPILDPAAPPQTAAPVPRWHLHRRLYNWMLSFAHSPYATPALFMFSVTEAIFFPVPPFVLQVPLTIERREQAWWYAGISTAGSILGGLIGYALGGLFHGLAVWLFTEPRLHTIDPYMRNVWLLTAGVLAVHPFKLFTIAAGALQAPLLPFIIASAIGRAALFFGIGALVWAFGPPIRVFIDRYFNLLTVALGVLIVGVVVAVKFWH
ncbi:MAG: DedA family protein [Phycisphaerales bacterium]|nr:DedA family protein [Phycisphaerales bacterium]